MERLDGTKSPRWRSKPGSSESPTAGVLRPPCALRWCVHGVVCGGGCGEAPMRLSCLGGLGFSAIFQLFGV
jgi:hypothetical protein